MVMVSGSGEEGGAGVEGEQRVCVVESCFAGGTGCWRYRWGNNRTLE